MYGAILKKRCCEKGILFYSSWRGVYPKEWVVATSEAFPNFVPRFSALLKRAQSLYEVVVQYGRGAEIKGITKPKL
ncbi:hypothetical protein HQ36_01720 [Porphyromonas gingivicanis]|uniref:Uncharacterized protein n=1 Tax=Porphyromonas gingivicanis TaxID=266762 RepID=A0A0A2G9X4_9PORP|nr:hypothetical protein [Porphyromonas gingivicanis]KGN99195.1 hypothetical protein HQ36_01720 [Porphyromonas gingivicanis]